MVSLQTVLATYIVLEVEDMVVVVERDSLHTVLWYIEDRMEQSSKFQLLERKKIAKQG